MAAWGAMAGWIAAGAGALMAAEAAAKAWDLTRRDRDERRHLADVYAAEGARWAQDYFREFARFRPTFAWSSYVYWKPRPFSGRFITVGAEGLRRTVPEGDDSLPMVLVLGGSVVWGEGVRDEGTLPSRLALRLAAAGRPCRVVNGAQLGSVSSQDLLSLLLWLQGGRRPAVVVMMPGFNDVFSAELNGRAGLPHKEWHRRSEFNIQLSQRRLLAALLRNSGLGRLILGYETEAPDRRVLRPDTDALADRTAAILDANLRCARALAAEFGCHLHAFWHPHLFAKQTPTPYERDWRDSIAFGRPLYEAVERRLPRDGTLTDLGGLFAADNGPTFLDYAHPGESANDRLAQVIAAPVLRSLGSIPVAKETVPC